MKKIPLIENDTYLKPWQNNIEKILHKYELAEKAITKKNKKLSNLINGHLYYGIHSSENEWIIREWAPNANSIWLIGDFNNWKKDDNCKFYKTINDDWELKISKSIINHGDLYKLIISWNNGEGERIPAWCNRVIQDENSKLFSAQIWSPEKKYKWKYSIPCRPLNPLIYEAHIGMSLEEGKVASYSEFRLQVLPRIAELGYNVLQLMAIQEHPYYGSFGYHVSSLFAASSRFGTPEELKELIDEAHRLGLFIIMDIVHSHAVKNENEGLSKYDGTQYQFFHDGERGLHPAWDSRCFDYSKPEVIHFLLSNCKYWLEEYHFDGFRFDGVTSMIFKDHGLGRDFLNYSDYYNENIDEDALIYLRLANKLIHEIHPNAITIAEDMSGMPGMASAIDYGGFGFDYRLAMGIPDFWIKYIKEIEDEVWNVSEIYHRLTDKRADEQVITYAESHDQALVGDKTIIFRLIDADMYYNMNCNQKNLIVDRGIALHKMIRLITLSTTEGGYLNFMGNEFGHPEWIDFPREGNNWSYHYARRQWHLADDENLKYHYLNLFDKDMIQTFVKNEILNSKPVNILQNISDQILVFKRGKYLFVFNFNPNKSFTDYGIENIEGNWKTILNTDSIKYGGFGLNDDIIIHHSININNSSWLKLYIPARCGFIMKQI